MFPSNWTSFRPSQSTSRNTHMPVVRNPGPAQIYPRAGIALPQMAFAARRNVTVKICPSYRPHVPHATYLPENIENTTEMSNTKALDHYYGTAEEHQKYYKAQDNTVHDTNTSTNAEETDTVHDGNKVMNDSLDYYLKLPKELFPSAKNIMTDPNPIIDEFCKLPNIENHVQWILDLEFGVRKSTIPRSGPLYNIKRNSINCLSAPEVIHPDFEKCNEDFKRVYLGYYDLIVSTWYYGYIMLTGDSSVDNFQAWLSLPTQILGMNWA